MAFDEDRHKQLARGVYRRRGHIHIGVPGVPTDAKPGFTDIADSLHRGDRR